MHDTVRRQVVVRDVLKPPDQYRQDAGAAVWESAKSSRRAELTSLRVRHRAEARLGLLGEACQYHGNVIPRVLVSSAGDHDAGTMESAPVAGRLEG